MLPLPLLSWAKIRGRNVLCGATPSDAYVTAVIVALWMMHPMVLRECLLALITTRVGDDRYVAADMSVSISDPKASRYLRSATHGGSSSTEETLDGQDTSCGRSKKARCKSAQLLQQGSTALAAP